MQERVTDFDPRFKALPPRRANLVVVLVDVLVVAVESQRESDSGTAGGGFETVVRGDQIVRQNPAVAPAANAQLVWVGQSHVDHMIHPGVQIENLFLAPIAGNGNRILLSTPIAAPIVHLQNRVPSGGKHLPFERPRMLILAVRPAMNAEQQRNLRPRDIVHRLDQ